MTGTLHFLPVSTVAENRLRAHETADESILLGMPHLCIGGISETWLLKELGHRHWQMLAQAAGRAVPDFHDRDGSPVYAAFNAVSLRDLDLAAARENDGLNFLSAISRLSRTQFRSVHKLFLRGRTIGTIELVSVFVKRTVSGRNRSIVRVGLAGLPPIGHEAEDVLQFVNDAAAIRNERWATHMGFMPASARPLFRHEIDPCPSQDFNGAGFLYCATFQAFVDRAEWAYRRGDARPAATIRRDIVFRGNIDIGERVAVTFLVRRETERGLDHWCRITRLGGEEVLADVFTHRICGDQGANDGA